VSHLTRKNGSRSSVAAAAQRARDAASQAGPIATNAAGIAKNAGLTARHSAEDALAWATPRVDDARAWAAPYVEQAGLAVRDKIAPAITEKIAPAISDALVDAAHRLDVSAPRRRLWPRVLAGIAMVAAAGSAVAAAVLRRRPTGMEFGSTGDTSDSGATAQGATDGMATGEGAGATPSDPATSSQDDDKEGKTNGRMASS
jgi:hypothetical protein